MQVLIFIDSSSSETDKHWIKQKGGKKAYNFSMALRTNSGHHQFLLKVGRIDLQPEETA